MFTSKKLLAGLFAILIVLALALSAGLFPLQSVHAAGASLNSGESLLPPQPKSNITWARAATSPLPTWTSSFTYNGTTYPYMMIGTDPGAGSVTTSIPVTIVPLKIIFSNGTVFNGAKQVTKTVNSPIFQSALFSSGTTQYGDAMQRAEFWQSVSTTSPDYHVLLDTPTIAPTTTIKVPAADGYTGTTASGKVIGFIDQSWFLTQLEGMLGSNNISPAMLPIFLSYNVGLDQGTTCCYLGYHVAMYSNLQTFIWATYNDPGTAIGSLANVQDITSLSHEVAEWMNDPFVNNIVPGWIVSQFYGCTDLLEVGDPLVGTVFKVKVGTRVYHPQDIAFLSWFARQSPSTSIKGRYTYLGTFTTYSPSC